VAGKSALICGSMAWDTIMVFKDRFSNHILPDKIHRLNVSFLVPGLRREFGGCAGNIAYNLKLLGDTGYPMATVGRDFGPYREWLTRTGVPADHIRVFEAEHTAQAFITTDLDDNQITAFHPGAMQQSHANKVSDARDVGIGIVAPDGRDGMIQHAREFHEADIPFIFDPGQGLPMFNGEELLDFIDKAGYVAVNDYEGQLLCERTGLPLEELAKRVKALIVTKGAEGSVIYASGEQIDIPCVKADTLTDPTGCGDAYRAGLLFGIANGMDWQTTGRLGALMGALKISHRGGQNHVFTQDEIDQRYFDNFGSRIL
jgi:adenosine kinase